MSKFFGILSHDSAHHTGNPLPGPAGAPQDATPAENGHYHFAPVTLSFQQNKSQSFSGRQPMTTQDRRYTVVCTGAILNYQNLRSRFIHPVLEYLTESDTEVLLFVYDRLEEKAFGQFEGTFALALWDNYERRLTFARDRSGKDTLYYCIINDSILFASAPEGIAAHLAYKSLSDIPGQIPVPDIVSFPAGHYAHINADSRFVVNPVPIA